MKCSFRRIATFLGGAVFIAFACLGGPNCNPTGGELPGVGGSAAGGNNNGGNGSGGSTNGGAGGSNSSGGNSAGSSGGNGSGGKSEGGSQSSGGKSGSGGSNNGGSAAGGSASGGSAAGTGGSVGGSTAAPTGGSGGGSPTGQKCAPTTATTPAITSTGGMACPGGLCTVGTYAGYLYVYADGEKSGPSKVCAAADSLCASGNTGVADTKGTIWGAGVGFNLDKSATPVAVQLAGTGMTYALSAMPAQGMRAQVSVAGTDYCVKLASASGTVAWTDFNTACWDNTGTKLTGAPSTPHIGFQVVAETTAGNFDFCVKSVTFN